MKLARKDGTFKIKFKLKRKKKRIINARPLWQNHSGNLLDNDGNLPISSSIFKEKYKNYFANERERKGIDRHKWNNHRRQKLPEMPKINHINKGKRRPR